ncbi:hypothetical protein WR25_07909 [Diploscapter pachys]|uniref:Uncharacterized protein n=1 Tax=Diploscapter pachys TaxID=2018661 RepID=A0A2A2M290_9BILA|nr:hypothetical protein WR25_07909 [Diploscapter pachys]
MGQDDAGDRHLREAAAGRGRRPMKLYCGCQPSPVPRPSVEPAAPLRSSIQPCAASRVRRKRAPSGASTSQPSTSAMTGA